MKKNIFKYTSLVGIGVSMVFLFQNCADFGAFSADYLQLASQDPHKDSWHPVQGLEVRDGEWEKIAEKVTQSSRGSDRNYIASVLYRAFLPPNTANWTTTQNKAIRNLIDQYVQRNFIDFGGPCFFTNPERTIGDTTVNCLGTNTGHAELQVIPGSNVFRSSLKYRLCDRLLQNNNALNNFKTNLGILSDLLETDDEIYAAHQMFFMGSNPRKRTVAALDDFYTSAAAKDQGTNQDEGLRHIALTLCSSTAWEAP